MGETECSEKCGNLTNQPNETMCDMCIENKNDLRL